MIIAIFCGPRHIDVTNVAIKEFNKIFNSGVEIYVFSPESKPFQGLIESGAIKKCFEDSEFYFLNEALVEIERSSKFNGAKRLHWYRQQLMKLTFPHLIFPSAIAGDMKMLIWDGDTVPLKTIEFFRDGSPVVNLSSSEYHWPYFLANQRILGGEWRLPYSSICQFMPILYSEWRELMTDLSGGHFLSEDLIGIINSSIMHLAKEISPLDGDSEFSEYELISSWRVKKRKYFITLIRKILRNGSGLKGPLSFRLWICNLFGAINVSFEDGLKSKFRMKLFLKSVSELLS